MSDKLRTFIEAHSPLCVLTGAGCSTPSGIFDYRDEVGNWKRTPPVLLQEFKSAERARQMYWSRSMMGWPRFHRARPNVVHKQLRRLEQDGLVQDLITQNVDNLHEQAGQYNLIQLHGSLSWVSCLDCRLTVDRQTIQMELERLNPEVPLSQVQADAGGEAIPEREVIHSFQVPTCKQCGGVLKPDVVFFGGSLDPAIKQAATNAIERANGLLVLGSSLMVYSSFRLVKLAHRCGIPIASITRGGTRADHLLTLRINSELTETFRQLAEGIAV